eukprot:SAG22_NODE_9240_length_601_cov_1.051793_1_plen_155_part_01
MPTGTAISWGNNIDNYSDGYAQHVWHAFNSFSTEWGGDREFMTFDPVRHGLSVVLPLSVFLRQCLSLLSVGPQVIGHFNGKVKLAAGADRTTYTLDRAAGVSVGNADKASLGGCVSVLQGTGAGQYHRFVSTNANSSSVTMDQPFVTALDESSVV